MTLTQARGNMSRKKLAVMVGVSYQMIYYIEKGIKRPSPETAMRIAKVLGIPPADAWNMFYVGQSKTEL